MKPLVIVSLIVFIAITVLLFAQPPSEYPLKTDLLEEVSGLALGIRNPNVLFAHNDSGGKSSVYAIDFQGNLLSEIHLPNVKNRDWEEIATAVDPLSKKPYIYIGEIGDNRAKHKNLKFYRFEEPLLKRAYQEVTEVETIKFKYEDGPRDAEAFFVHPKKGDIYVITKREEKVGVYLLPYALRKDKTLVAKKVATMQMNWVTAADISQDGKTILVKNYGSIRQFKVKTGCSIAKALGKEGKSMPYVLEPQGEAICFDKSGKGYFTLSELYKDHPQVLYHYK